MRGGDARHRAVERLTPAAAGVMLAALSVLAGAGGYALGDDTAPPVQSPPAATTPAAAAWLENLSLTGILNTEGRWQQHGGLDLRAGSTSDLYVRQFNLGIDARLLACASATVVLNSEWIGDFLHSGDSGIELEEVHVDLERGLYAVLGKRTQPFGQFESDLVTDPLPQDGYETNEVGATLGTNRLEGWDLSATAYKGTGQMDHLFESGLLDTTRIHRRAVEVREVESYVVAIQASPWRDRLTVSGAWLSEPGAGCRNTTGDAACTFALPYLPNLALNAEYVWAVDRAPYADIDRTRLESALSIAVSYAPGAGARHFLGRRDYRGRRSSHRAHPVVASIRYEVFDDDGLAAAAGAWSVERRVGAGARYAFENSGRVLAYAQGEVRRIDYRGRAAAHSRNVEAYLRVGIDF